MESDLRQHLAPGERILWTGRPKRGFMLRQYDLFSIPFSLLWGGFAFFWEYIALTMGSEPIMALWGVPFVLVAVYLIAGRFVIDAKIRANTIYAVADQRAIILLGLFRRKLRSISLHALNDISLYERRDGSGTITFGPGMNLFSWSSEAPWAEPAIVRGFERIPNVKTVFELIQTTQRRSLTGF